MSLIVTTKSGEIETNFSGFPFDGVDGVRVGQYEMSLEDFAAMATHFLSGGFFGWRNGDTPKLISDALSSLFDLYERKEGNKWIRRDAAEVYKILRGEFAS